MIIKSFCPPAIVYLVFSFTHVLMAIFDNDKKGAFLQAIMGILITLLLQFLCMSGLSILSWIIAFLPLIFYTYMVILLYSIFEKGDRVKNNRTEVKGEADSKGPDKNKEQGKGKTPDTKVDNTYHEGGSEHSNPHPTLPYSEFEKAKK